MDIDVNSIVLDIPNKDGYTINIDTENNENKLKIDIEKE